MKLNFKSVLSMVAVAATFFVAAPQAQAATLTLGDPAPAGLVYSGNAFTPNGASCPVPGICWKLNPNPPSQPAEFFAVTATTGTFDLYSFFLGINGNSQVGVNVVAETSGGVILDQDYFTQGTVSYAPALEDLIKVTFTKLGQGTTEIGGVMIGAPAVPVPAAGFLLIGGLGGLMAFKRRKLA